MAAVSIASREFLKNSQIKTVVALLKAETSYYRFALRSGIETGVVRMTGFARQDIQSATICKILFRRQSLRNGTSGVASDSLVNC
jgi:hypothetical protein